MSSRTVINEASECYAVCAYKDENGVAFTPNGVRYRVDDITNGVIIVPWTSISGLSTSNRVTITATQNNMSAGKRNRETRQVAFEVTPMGATPRISVAYYDLLRLFGVP